MDSIELAVFWTLKCFKNILHIPHYPAERSHIHIYTYTAYKYGYYIYIKYQFLSNMNMMRERKEALVLEGRCTEGEIDRRFGGVSKYLGTLSDNVQLGQTKRDRQSTTSAQGT